LTTDRSIGQCSRLLQMKELTRRVFHRWLVPALLEWAAIVALFWIGFTAHHWFVWILVVIVLGSRQHALGVLGHDGAHYTAARNKRVNDIASALLCFWPVLTSLADFRRFHYNHHRYFNSEYDPEIVFKNHMSARQWQIPISRKQILLYLVGDFCGLSALEVVKARRVLSMVGPEFENAPGRTERSAWKPWIGPCVWLVVVGSILYSTGLLIALAVWVIALLTSFWAFFRLRTWTEHGGTSSTHRIWLNRWQKLLITPHGSWSHYEHHAQPGIPFWSRHLVCDPAARTMSLWEFLGSFQAPDSISLPSMIGTAAEPYAN